MQNLVIIDSCDRYTINRKTLDTVQEKIKDEINFFNNKNLSSGAISFGSVLPDNLLRFTDRISNNYSKISNNINTINKKIKDYDNIISFIERKYKKKDIPIKNFSKSRLFEAIFNKRPSSGRGTVTIDENKFKTITGPFIDNVTAFSSDLYKTLRNANEDMKKHDNKKEYRKATWIITLIGLGQVVEQTADCTIQATSEILVYGAQSLSWLFEKMGLDENRLFIIDESIDTVKDGVAKIVGTNWVNELTNAALAKAGLEYLNYKDDIAKTIRSTEDTVGSIMLGKLPGPWSAIAKAVTAEGKAAEQAYQNGATYDGTALVSHVDGAIAFGSTYGGKYVKTVLSDSKVGQAAAKALNNIANETVKSGARYVGYESSKTDESGNLKYDNFLDYYTKSGTLSKTLVGSMVTFASTYTPSEVSTYAFKFGGQATAIAGVVAFRTTSKIYPLLKNSEYSGDSNIIVYNSYDEFFEVAKNLGLQQKDYGTTSAVFDSNKGIVYMYNS